MIKDFIISIKYKSKKIKNYIKFNKKNFFFNSNNSSQILLEFNNFSSFHISSSYLVEALQKKFGSKIIAYKGYSIYEEQTLQSKIKWLLGIIFNIRTFKLYRSIGADQFISINKKNTNEVNRQFRFLKKKIKSKKDIENICLEKIWVGDLIYDTYLRKYRKSTIEINDDKFFIFLKNCIQEFYFWFEYFKKNNIKAIISSHAVYLYAMPMRIAINHNIPSYVPDLHKLYYFNKENVSFKNKKNEVFFESKFFKKKFNLLSLKKKSIGLKEGKKILSQKILGKEKQFYMERYKNNKKIINIKIKKKIRVMIAMHTFTDSPHVFGCNFFTDFYEWLKFLSNIVKRTDYEWYIKPHPNNILDNLNEIKMFVKKNQKIQIIPHDFGIPDIKKLKIDFILTIFGTVASEYPAMGIQVINASRNTPFKFFNFSKTPENIKKYKSILLKLDSYKCKINLKEIYMFHYMNNIYYTRNYLFEKFDFLIKKKIKNYNDVFSDIFYEIWIKNTNERQLSESKEEIKKFIESGEYVCNPKNINNQN
jgi:hypothetical protein